MINDNIKSDKIEFGSSNDSLGEHTFTLKILDDDEKLKIIIANMVKGKIANNNESNEIISDLLNENIPINFDRDDIYEIVFPRYIIYQVRNESYCSYDDYEIRKGKTLHIYEKSKFIDYLKTTVDHALFPDEWKHYGISSDNHSIDIVSHEKPIIKKVY